MFDRTSNLSCDEMFIHFQKMDLLVLKKIGMGRTTRINSIPANQKWQLDVIHEKLNVNSNLSLSLFPPFYGYLKGYFSALCIKDFI